MLVLLVVLLVPVAATSASARAAAASGTGWAAYTQAFGKTYSGYEDEEYRRGIYERSLAKYAELNALEPLAHYGPTRLSDRAPREYLRGYAPSPIADTLPELDAHMGALAGGPADQPASRDWSGSYTSPIKDQGSCGGCWAESAIEQVESDAMREHNWTGVLSTQQLVDCTSRGQGSWRGGCGGGNPVPGYQVLQALGGAASGYAYKYEGRDARCNTSGYKKYVKVDAFHSVAKGNETAMKRYIASTGTLSVCVDASDWGGYTRGIKTTCGTATDHCVQLVGYGSEAGTDYWKVRNSWGSAWGEHGFIRLRIGGNLCNIADGPTATSTSVVAPAPVPSPSPSCSDHPIDWRSSEGDPCSLYDLNSYCTTDGREGDGWNTCAWGNITAYADSNGVSALEACCACGGGTAPAPPAPPAPAPPRSNCSDHPKNWRSSEGDSCCVYQWDSYCTPGGGEGPSWDKAWGPISDYADKKGVSALGACCACGGGRHHGHGGETPA